MDRCSFAHALVALCLLPACTAIAPFDMGELPPGDQDPDEATDGDAGRDTGRDAGRDADETDQDPGDADTFLDAELEPDADVPPPDGDTDGSCEPVPTGLSLGDLVGAGCPALASEDLISVTITQSCVADTDLCDITCSGRGPFDGLGTCVVPVASGAVSGDELCVLVVADLSLESSGQLTAQGGRGLAILSRGPLQIGAALASNASGQNPGAGGWLGGQESDGLGLGGGLAGSAGSAAGGGGGAGSSDGADGGCVDSGGGGTLLPDLCAEPRLYGGSGGGALGCSETPPCGSPNWGGGGGGAVQLFSMERIVIAQTGALSVEGGQGAATAGSNLRGGGGGGAGGTILLEAPQVRVDGTISAHGGNGGHGLGDAPGGQGAATDEAAPGQCSEAFDGIGGGGGGGRGAIFVRSFSGMAGAGTLSPRLAECLSAPMACQ